MWLSEIYLLAFGKFGSRLGFFFFFISHKYVELKLSQQTIDHNIKTVESQSEWKSWCSTSECYIDTSQKAKKNGAKHPCSWCWHRQAGKCTHTAKKCLRKPKKYNQKSQSTDPKSKLNRPYHGAKPSMMSPNLLEPQCHILQTYLVSRPW